MKKSLFLLPLLIIGLISCNPTNDDNNSNKPKQDIHAEIGLRATSFTYNQNSGAAPYRDPVLVDIFLNGSTTPAIATDLAGGDIAAGNAFFYYLGVDIKDDHFRVTGATQGRDINENFNVGYVIDGVTLVTSGNGGFMLEDNGSSPNTTVLATLTLYRADISEENFSFTQVSESKELSITTKNESMRLRAKMAKDTQFEQTLSVSGSDSFTVTVTNFTLDDNPLGTINLARLYLNIEVLEGGETPVTTQFHTDEATTPNGARYITVSVKGAPAGSDYRLYVTPELVGVTTGERIGEIIITVK